MKTENLKSQLQIGALALFIASLSACGSSTLESVQLPSELTPVQDYGLSVNSYRATLYPVVRQYCGSCHGGNQSPNFAAIDLPSAHDSLMLGGKIDFTNIDRSPLVLRLTQQSHGCWTGSCDADAEVLEAAIESWGRLMGESRPSNPITVRTAEVVVPTFLPTGSTNNQQNTTDMIWDLSLAMQPNPAPQRATITFEVSRFDQYSYFISRPTVRTNAPLFIRGIHILVNGVPSRTATFRTINTTIPIQTNNPAPLLTSALLTEMANGPGLDRISIGFEEIRLASFGAEQRFQAVRNLVAQQNSCFQCHSAPAVGSTQEDVPTFPNFLTEQEFLNAGNVRGVPFVVPGNPTASLLWIATSRTPRPTKQRMPLNRSQQEQDEANAIITDWIQKIGQP